MYKQVKRYNCTVSDKRGFQGKCMELSESGSFITHEDHQKCVNFFVKKEKRKSEGTSKLLSALNSGKSVMIQQPTIDWLKRCGFNLKVVDVPYQGSLPLYDRIVSYSVSLDK